ncbi:DoxX family protein [Nocardia sp. KC 131]|uniref:DoxX family protein n=1 Tax=Nocardia arseniciresistens TaxID=3392119 RepID=UPI00398E3761
MFATTALAVVLGAIFAVVGVSMTLALDFQRTNATHLGFSVVAFRYIGALALLGATGVLVGLALPVVGILAATGIVALMIGAAVCHLRVRDRADKLIPPIVVAALAVGYLISMR